jgi:mRNA interferase RelE/StbE
VLHIRIADDAASFLLGLPERQAKQIDARILRLASDPFPQGCVKLQGSSNVFRVRQGAYRILYRVQYGENLLFVDAIGDRKNIYR